MKFTFPVPEQCSVGRDADPSQKTDMAFYDWVKGKDERASITNFLLSLIDDLKEQKNSKELSELLQSWQTSCTPEEFESRLTIFEKLLPPNHAFHALKKEFVK